MQKCSKTNVILTVKIKNIIQVGDHDECNITNI